MNEEGEQESPGLVPHRLKRVTIHLSNPAEPTDVVHAAGLITVVQLRVEEASPVSAFMLMHHLAQPCDGDAARVEVLQ